MADDTKLIPEQLIRIPKPNRFSSDSQGFTALTISEALHYNWLDGGEDIALQLNEKLNDKQICLFEFLSEDDEIERNSMASAKEELVKLKTKRVTALRKVELTQERLERIIAGYRRLVDEERTPSGVKLENLLVEMRSILKLLEGWDTPELPIGPQEIRQFIASKMSEVMTPIESLMSRIDDFEKQAQHLIQLDNQANKA